MPQEQSNGLAIGTRVRMTAPSTPVVVGIVVDLIETEDQTLYTMEPDDQTPAWPGWDPTGTDLIAGVPRDQLEVIECDPATPDAS